MMHMHEIKVRYNVDNASFNYLIYKISTINDELSGAVECKISCCSWSVCFAITYYQPQNATNTYFAVTISG